MHSSLVALAVALACRCAWALPAVVGRGLQQSTHRRALLAAINASKPQEVYSPENDWTNDANNYLDDYISRLTELEEQQAAAAQGGGAGGTAGAGGAGEAGAAGGMAGGSGEGGGGEGGGVAGAGGAGGVAGGNDTLGGSEPGAASGAGTSGAAAGGEAGGGEAGPSTDSTYGPGPEDLNRLNIRDIDYIVDQPNYVEQYIAPKKYAALENAGMSGEVTAEAQQQVPVSGMAPIGGLEVPASTAVAQQGERTSNISSSNTFLYRKAQKMQMERRELAKKSSGAAGAATNSSSETSMRTGGKEPSAKKSDADSAGMVREAWKKAESADKDLENIVKDVLLASSA